MILVNDVYISFVSSVDQAKWTYLMVMAVVVVEVLLLMEVRVLVLVLPVDGGGCGCGCGCRVKSVFVGENVVGVGGSW